MGKGGSSSQAVNTTQATVTSTNIVNMDTKALAKALQEKTKADLTIGKADLILKNAEAKAKLEQNAVIANDIKSGLKKYIFLGGFAYAGYKIMKKKR